MKKIKIKRAYEFPHYDDCSTIVAAMASEGYLCSTEEARELWEMYSDSWAAGWLILPSDQKKIVESIKPFFEVDE
jgi:hypothetical protein